MRGLGEESGGIQVDKEDIEVAQGDKGDDHGSFQDQIRDDVIKEGGENSMNNLVHNIR